MWLPVPAIFCPLHSHLKQKPMSLPWPMTMRPLHLWVFFHYPRLILVHQLAQPQWAGEILAAFSISLQKAWGYLNLPLNPDLGHLHQTFLILHLGAPCCFTVMLNLGAFFIMLLIFPGYSLTYLMVGILPNSPSSLQCVHPEEETKKPTYDHYALVWEPNSENWLTSLS